MTKQQKLTKVIERAVERGWIISKDLPERLEELLDMITVGSKQHIGESSIRNALWTESHYRILFSHDFAKAYWGEKEVETWHECGNCCTKEMNWQYHLQQAVISKDPIDYYYKNK